MTKPLLLIPGILSDATAFAPQIEALADIAAPQVAASGADSIEAMAAEILDRAPDRFALCGHSMGGYVALAMLRQAPDRIERLALLSTSARPDTDEQKAARRGLMAAAEDDFEAVIRRMMAAMLHPDRLTDVALLDQVHEMMRRSGLAAFLRQQTATMGRADSRDLLPRVAVPTLVLGGAEDKIVSPAFSQELAEQIPGAVAVRLAACGHIPTLEQADAVTSALRRWLN